MPRLDEPLLRYGLWTGDGPATWECPRCDGLITLEWPTKFACACGMTYYPLTGPFNDPGDWFAEYIDGATVRELLSANTQSSERPNPAV